MAVVAQSNNNADHWLRSVLSGRPLDGSCMQTAASFGAITLRDGSVKAKVQLLPFDGSEYGVFAFVDSALLLNEAHCGMIQQQTILSVSTSVQSWYGAERSTVGGQRRDYMG